MQALSINKISDSDNKNSCRVCTAAVFDTVRRVRILAERLLSYENEVFYTIIRKKDMQFIRR